MDNVIAMINADLMEKKTTFPSAFKRSYLGSTNKMAL